MADSVLPDFKPTEIVLFIGGALMTITVFVIAVALYRVASREHRQQLESERKEQARKEPVE